MTGETDWGGWRVPGAEYDLDPGKIERQAQMIAAAPQLASIARMLDRLGAPLGRGNADRTGRSGASRAGRAQRRRTQGLTPHP